MIEHKRKRASLVERLRAPTARTTAADLAPKIDAIGEALAYLIDKKWAKQKRRKVKKQQRKGV